MTLLDRLRLLLGIACLAVPTWVAATRWSTLLAGHPAYPTLLGVVAALGVLLVVGAARRRGHLGGRLRAAGRGLGVTAVVVVLAAVVWLRPYPADATAVAATVPGPSVDVVGSLTTWELRPRATTTGVGVVFFPGALVDPRAYLALLRPLAESGHLVVVVKPPLDFALLAPGAASTAIEAHPEVRRWAVGGHSLGGVPAAGAADGPRVAGLFLWASYPARDLSGSSVAATSISGDRDGLATPDDVDASRADLPAATLFTVVPGGVHAFFGDYGAHSGDGEPGITRAEAQRLIVTATVAFVDGLPRP